MKLRRWNTPSLSVLGVYTLLYGWPEETPLELLNCEQNTVVAGGKDGNVLPIGTALETIPTPCSKRKGEVFKQ